MALVKADVSTMKMDVNSIRDDILLIKWMLAFIAVGVVSLVIKAYGQ